MILWIKYWVLDDQMRLAYADGPVIILLPGLLLQLVEAKITLVQIQMMIDKDTGTHFNSNSNNDNSICIGLRLK